MVKHEADASRELRRRLESLGCLTEKLNGNMFQNGLPDLLVALATQPRRLALVEMKAVPRASRFEKTSDLLDLLRTGKQGSRQFVVWSSWGCAGWPVFLYAHAYEDNLWAGVKASAPTTAWLSAKIPWGTLDGALQGLFR